MKNNKLHTDLLEKMYGEVRISIIFQSDFLRVVNIVDSKGISRTHAMSVYTYNGKSEKIHALIAEIKNGSSIGKTVMKYGYIFEKKIIKQGICLLNKNLKKYFSVQSDNTSFRIYQMSIKDSSKKIFPFMIICEILTPLIKSQGDISDKKEFTYRELISYLKKSRNKF